MHIYRFFVNEKLESIFSIKRMTAWYTVFNFKSENWISTINRVVIYTRLKEYNRTRSILGSFEDQQIFIRRYYYL